MSEHKHGSVSGNFVAAYQNASRDTGVGHQGTSTVSRSNYHASRSDKKFGISPSSVTPAQAARIIGCSADSIRKRCRLGEIKTIHGFTRPYRIPQSEINGLLSR